MISINDESLDIFASPVVKKYPWKPIDIKPYEELSTVVMDIETTRIPSDICANNPRALELKLVGLQNERGQQIILECNTFEEERAVLIKLNEIMMKKKADVILLHNGFHFDLPALEGRYTAHGLPNPFWYSEKPRTFRPAVVAGAHLFKEYTEVHSHWGDFVDTIQLTIAWDSVARQLESYSLKSVPVALNLRAADERVYQSMEDLEAAYEAGIGSDLWNEAVEYLRDDLRDTQLLTDLFLPAVWGQGMFFPYKRIQKLALAGAASKWQALLESFYPKDYVKSLPELEKEDYEGAYTFSSYGLAKNVVEADVSSLYPSVILKYGLGPRQDYLGVMHGALEYIFREKAKLDAKIAAGVKLDANEKNLRGTLKLCMNTAYGALACEIPFGDFHQAAMVTAYGRAVCKHMGTIVTDLGGDVRLQDTDSCYWASETPEQAEVIYQELLASMPAGIGLAKEDLCPLYFVPPKNLPSDFDKSYKFKSVNGKKLVAKLFGDIDVAIDPDRIEKVEIPEEWLEEKVSFHRLQELASMYGQNLLLDSTRKTYIKFVSPDRITSKGLLAKRNTSILEKTTYIDWMKAIYAGEDPKTVYANTREELTTGLYPTAKLGSKRTISVAEKRVVDLGLGQPGDKIFVWVGPEGEPTTSGGYDIEHYVGKLDLLWEKFTTK